MASSARTSIDKDTAGLFHPPTSSSPQSLSQALHARRSEYTRPQKIRIKVGTWNVAALPGTENDLGGWFVEGKGIDQRLAGIGISDWFDVGNGQNSIESVGAQEDRSSKKESTIPHGDKAAVIGGEDIGLYVLGLQEVVGLTSAKEYIGKVYTDPGPTAKWRNALSDALPLGYQLVAEQQLSGLLLLVFASPAIAPTVSSVSTVSVGTGIMGYLGNKGAVTTRIVLGETTRIVLVNCHLASGTDPAHLERRCWDVSQILQRTRFEPINWGGVLDNDQEGIGDEDFAFWFGDLNFRLDGLPGEDTRRLLMLHMKGEYDIGQESLKKLNGKPSEHGGPIAIGSVDSDDDLELEQTMNTTFDHGNDSSSVTLPDPDDFIQDPSQNPASIQATLDSLLPHDQLRLVQRKRKAFHDGWREGPIMFLPTYKYDVGSVGMFDSSEKKRAPSWCDRILFRTRRDKFAYEGKLQEEILARIKDDEMRAMGMDHAGDDEDVLFDYNPDEDGVDEAAVDNDYDEYDQNEGENFRESTAVNQGFVDRIQLEVYTSHQRVLSSDHKPLDAVFTLEYDAVVPELKSKIQQEVARELDRAENEGRPGITVVVDHSQEVEDVAKTDRPTSRRLSTGRVEGVELGDVAFRRRKFRGLTIANTSQVAANFAFVERPSSSEGSRIAPSWLNLSFAGPGLSQDEQVQMGLKREVTLQPGDTINITLEVFVDDIKLVKQLNEGRSQLDDVLVLRVKDGRDHFVPVYGSWLQSCFGLSIDELIRVPEGGVRSLPPRINITIGGSLRAQEVCWSAPRELFKLTEAVELLTDRVIADANMLESVHIPKESTGWPFNEKSWQLKDNKAREIRKEFVLEALDSDKNLNDVFPPEIPAIEKLEIMAEILIMFLDSLTDGIVTEELWAKLDQDFTARGTDPEEIKSWVLDILSASPNHNISFVFLTSMLCRVASELAPVPKIATSSITGSARSSMEAVRRSLSFRGKPPPLPSDPAVMKRQAVEREYAEVFASVIFRGPALVKEKERKSLEEKRKEILEIFLNDSR